MSGYSLVVGAPPDQVTGSEQRPLDAAVVAIIDTVRVVIASYTARTNILVLSVGSLAASCLRSVNDNKDNKYRTTD